MSTMSERRKQAYDVLRKLAAFYGRTHSLVGHPANMERLPVLRSLEWTGLAEIKVVLMEKRWVPTAAGAIWMALFEAGPDKDLSLDRDILCSDIGFWMTRAEAVEGMLLLKRYSLCRITKPDGAALPPEQTATADAVLRLVEGNPIARLVRFQPPEIEPA